MSQTTLSPTGSSRLGPRQIAIIALAVISGLVHLYRASLMFMMMGSGRMMGGGRPGGGRPPGGGGSSILAMLPVPLPVLFLLNFVGYIVLALALYLPALQQYRKVTRWILIAYTAITVIMWFLITGGRPDVIGYSDKVVEIALIVLLLIDSFMPAPAKS